LYHFSDTFRHLLSFQSTHPSKGTGLALDKQLMGIAIGSTVVMILGMVDDYKPVIAAVKFPIQIIAAYMAMDYGVRISGLTFPHIGYVSFPLLVSQVITVLWITGFMNSINLIDGLDGLAAGLVAIAAGTFMVIAILQWDSKILMLSNQMKLAAILAAVLSGSAFGFLFFNFFPAKTFMGDGGALFIGFLLGTITVIGTLKTAAVVALVVPLIVVAVPVLDVAFAMVRRLYSHQGIMEPDRKHFHHRLLAWGWTQREAVLLIYVMTLVLAIVSIVLTVLKARG
jgi:UDP-GlcNAc:undecaprenyl-phosphate GlcNAc-1-phosphate transferase